MSGLNGKKNGAAIIVGTPRPEGNPSIATRMVLVRRTLTDKVFTAKYRGKERTRVVWEGGLVVYDDGETLTVKLDAPTACSNLIVKISKMGDEWKLRYP